MCQDLMDVFFVLISVLYGFEPIFYPLKKLKFMTLKCHVV